MTEVASRAAQSQSIIDTISRPASAKTGAQAYRAGSKPSQNPQDADGSNDRVPDRSGDKAQYRGNRSDLKSVDAAAKVSQKPNRENEKDDDSEKSFETTIDTLCSQMPSGNLPTTVTETPPAAWSAELALQSAQDQAPNNDSKSTPTNAVLPGHLLKQASVVALLDAKQRLLAAQVTDPATEETVATPVAVHSREAHWVFDDASAASRNRTFEALASKENPLAALPAATANRSEDATTKASADIPIAARAADQTPANGTAPQQNFGGAQGGRPGPREQSGAPDTSARRILDTAATAPAEHVSQDSPEISRTMSAATQQVRSGVLTALADDSGSAQVSGPRQIADRPPVAGQVLRTIDLTLSPPDLGTVRLRLSLKSSALDIDAETSKAATAKLLDDDRKGLEQSLRDAGYDVKSLKISDISSTSNPSLNSSLNNGGSSLQDGSQARANFAGRQDEGMSRREGGTPDQSQQRQRDENRKTSAPDVANSRQANAIYI